MQFASCKTPADLGKGQQWAHFFLPLHSSLTCVPTLLQVCGGRNEVRIKDNLLYRFSYCYFLLGGRSVDWKELQGSDNLVP